MWDRYDPRDSEDRDRGGSWDRPRGSRGGRSDRDDERAYDPRDVFVCDVDLPLEPERELVGDPDRTYALNGTDSRVVVTVGAFRVVSESDLPAPKISTSFCDFEEYARLVAAAQSTDASTYLVVLLGGEAGLWCGEMIALEWKDVDLGKRQLCVERSDRNGQVTAPKGGRLRYVPMTVRLASALHEARHLRSPRVLCQDMGVGEPSRRSPRAIQRERRRMAVRQGFEPWIQVLARITV